MRIDMATEPGDHRRPNEDHVSAALPAHGHEGALVLLDGVTPPQDEDVGCRHGVPWFTARLGGALLELAGARPESGLADCLAEALERTADAHRSTCDLSHSRTPQSTVVAARWDQRAVECLVLSDSVLLLERTDGEVTPVLDERLDQLPPHVGELLERVRALPRSTPRRAAAAAEYAHAVEALRNAADGTGFHTAATDPGVAYHAVTATAPRADLRTLLALSDGAARWTETFRLGDWRGLLRLVRDEGAEALLARVRAAERADPDGAAYPRGKAHDDATALFLPLPPP